ncbi:MAG TPA: beta-1,3-glucanase family protein [Opitutaceae bacterium]|nr:beta-1,3-glucanase family protein [Opitutaceae bacterium]
MKTPSAKSPTADSSTPTISSISPNQAGLAQQISITIIGTNFTGVSLVSFDQPGSTPGSGPAGTIVSSSDTQITVTTPICPGDYPVSGSAVPVDITIGIGANDTQFSGMFSFQLPTVTSISPTSGPLAGGTPITVNGQYFTGAGTVLFDAAGAPTFQVLSDTLITCTNPNVGSACSANVSVMVQAQQSTSQVSFNYVAVPAVTQVSPNYGNPGATVTLTGTGFVGVTAVNFGGIAVPSGQFTVVSATEITVTVPGGGSGIVDITVTAGGGTSALGAADRFQFGTGPLTIPLTIDLTGAGLPTGTPAYAYLVGEVAQTGGVNTYYWLNPTTGLPQVMSTADNTNAAGSFPGSGSLPSAAQQALAANYPSAWANYSIPLSLTQPNTINLAGINPTTTPGLGTGTAAFSGRVYVSIGLPILPFTVQSGGYAAPVPAGTGSGQPGALCLFDWIEFSFDSNQNFNGNTTQVDQFSLPLTLNGTPGGSLQGVLNQSRSNIIAAFNTGGSVPAPIGQGALVVPVPAALVGQGVYPAGLANLRVMSPKNATGPATYSGPLATFFANAIATWYANWQTTPVVTQDVQTGYYTGFVPASGANAGSLCFYPGQLTTQPAGQPAFVLLGSSGQNIVTWDIWQCANSLALPNAPAAQLNVGKIIAAAFNRGALGYSLSDVTWNTGTFYPPNGTWNNWAQQFHIFSANGLAYGFPYDDVCQQNPSIDLTETLSVTIALGSLS